MWIDNLFDSLSNIKERLWRKRRELSYVAGMTYATFGVYFLSQTLLARLLGTVNYGIYVSSLAVLALIEVPLVLRAAEVSMRQLGRHMQNFEGNIVSVSRRLLREDVNYFLFSTILTIAASGWLSTLTGGDHSFFIILSLLIPAQIGYGIFKSYFLIFDIVPIIVRFEFVCALTLLVTTTIGYVALGMHGLATGYVVAMLLKTLLAYIFTRSHIPLRHGTGNYAKASSNHNDSFHSIFRNLCSNGINQVDIIILAALQGPHVVAIYKAAKSLSALPTKLSQPVWRYLQPKLLQAIQSDDRFKIQKIIFHGAVVLVVILVVVLLIALFAGQKIIALVYGQDYVQSYIPFLILLLGVWTFNGLTGWFKFWSVVSDSQRFSAGIYLSMLLTFGVIGYLFGSAGATEMAFTLSGVFIVFSALIALKVLVIRNR